MGRLRYNELVKGKIKPNKNIVLSEVRNDKGEYIGVSISEQLVVKEENDKEIRVFLKNGLGIVSDAGLMMLKQVVDEACEKRNSIIKTSKYSK